MRLQVLAWNMAFPTSVHMVLAVEALVTNAHVMAPVLPSLRSRG